MIIVSGRIYVSADQREAFLEYSRQSILEARMANGCRDFVVAADPIELDRVNVYEEWDSETQLESFRGSGPESDLAILILRADVTQHETRT
jgi:quinol monooxygenase YgiN